jgi:hypothetical protein
MCVSSPRFFFSASIHMAPTPASYAALNFFRYLFLAVDMSESCATTTDMPPNRAVVLTSLAKSFITEFFDQNPLSQMSVQVMRHSRVDTLSEVSASMARHTQALEGTIGTGGAVSLQNMLDSAIRVNIALHVQPPRHSAVWDIYTSIQKCKFFYKLFYF